MLQESAEKRVMHILGGRSDSEAARNLGIVDESFQQRPQRRDSYAVRSSRRSSANISSRSRVEAGKKSV